MGGFVAQSLVLDFPERVDRLILSATNFGGPRALPPTPEAMAVLTDVASDPLERLKRGILVSCAPGFEARQPQLVQDWLAYRIQDPILPAPYQAQLAVGLALSQEENSFERKLGQVKNPTLILFGEFDRVVPPGNAELLAQALPHARVTRLPDVGHFYPLEAPDTANQVIIQFLKGELPPNVKWD
jgi:pimeloyl-ACP methyl ester carboxylesterase